MTRRSPRIATIVPILVCVAGIAAMVTAGAAPASAPVAKKSCGTITSTSSFDRAEVIKIRGVGCRKARKVARRFDHQGEEEGHWQCGLAHNDAPRLFSCGRGPGSGDLRDRPHALEARGVTS